MEDEEAPKTNPLYEATFKVPDVYYFPWDKAGLEKPWVENADKTEDYFNYGMYSAHAQLRDYLKLNLP